MYTNKNISDTSFREGASTFKDETQIHDLV